MTRARGNKRNSNGNSKRDAKKAKSTVKEEEIGPDGYGALFSRLPDDCLVEVFKNFTRNDIQVLKSVNSRTMEISNHSGLNNIKWAGGILDVFQTSEGYGFELEIQNWDQEGGEMNSNYPLKRSAEEQVVIETEKGEIRNNSIYSFQYEIVRTTEGIFKETKTVNSILRSSTSNRPHAWPIPDQLFVALGDIGRVNGIEEIDTTTIPFNSYLWAKLEEVLRGHSCRKIISGGLGGEPVTNENRRSFMYFVQKMKAMRSINFANSTDLRPIINEELIINFGQLDTLKCSSPYKKPNEVYANRFYPNESILSHLIHFSKLEVAHMILKAEWIVRLCLMKLSELNEESFDEHFSMKWKFSVDKPLNRNQITRRMPPGYEFNTDLITRKRDKVTVMIDSEDIPVNNGSLHYIELKFFYYTRFS